LLKLWAVKWLRLNKIKQRRINSIVIIIFLVICERQEPQKYGFIELVHKKTLARMTVNKNVRENWSIKYKFPFFLVRSTKVCCTLWEGGGCVCVKAILWTACCCQKVTNRRLSNSPSNIASVFVSCWGSSINDVRNLRTFLTPHRYAF
jgi:hypothetical protein